MSKKFELECRRLLKSKHSELIKRPGLEKLTIEHMEKRIIKLYDFLDYSFFIWPYSFVTE